MQTYPNYQQPIEEALIVLEDSGIDRFPVDLHVIQQQYKNLFKIRSFGSLMKEQGISREECIRVLGSSDGAVVFDGCSKYIIYYNETMRKQRTRFTIAHEIGHILLDHHQEHGNPILGKGGVGPALYKRLEHEADCFARNLLSPAYHAVQLLEAHGITRVFGAKDEWIKTAVTQVTENLKTGFRAETLISAAFDVSASAAKTRVNLLKVDMNKSAYSQIDWKLTSHIKHTAVWHCPRCGSEKLPRASCCSKCGSKSFVFQVKSDIFRY